RSRDDEFDDDDDRPRRRRGRRKRAKNAVTGPGVALLTVAILGTLLAIMNCIWSFTGHAAELRNEDAASRFVYYSVIVLQLVWGILATAGGVCMLTLKLRPLAIIGAVFAALPCNVFCLGGLPIGIWALVVLGKPHVRDEFD